MSEKIRFMLSIRECSIRMCLLYKKNILCSVHRNSTFNKNICVRIEFCDFLGQKKTNQMERQNEHFEAQKGK